MKTTILISLFFIVGCKIAQIEKKKAAVKYETLFYESELENEISISKREFISKNIIVITDIYPMLDFEYYRNSDRIYYDTFFIDEDNWYIKRSRIYQPYFCDCFDNDSNFIFKLKTISDGRIYTNNGFMFFSKVKKDNFTYYYLSEDYKFEKELDTIYFGFPFYIFNPKMGIAYYRSRAEIKDRVVSYARYDKNMKLLDSNSINLYYPLWLKPEK